MCRGPFAPAPRLRVAAATLSARLVAPFLVGLAALVGVAGVAGSVVTGWASPAGAQEPPAPAGSPTLTLLDQTTWVEPDDGGFRLDVRGRGLPPGAQIATQLYPRLGSRDEFVETLEGTLDDDPLHDLDSRPVADLRPDASGNMTLNFDLVGPEGAGLTADEFGVYPVEVVVTDANGEPLDGLLTYAVLQPPAGVFSPLSLAVVMEVGAPPAQQPDGSVELSPDEIGSVRDRVEVLERTTTPVSVAPVPETLDALTEAPLAEGLVDDLGTALRGDEILARPFVDIDLQAFAQADLVTEAPREAQAGADVIRGRFAREPTPDVWLTGPTVGQIEARTWRELGVRYAVAPSGAIESLPGAEPSSVAQPALLPDGPPAFISDDALVERLVGMQDRRASQSFLAELAMIFFEFPARSRSVVLRLPPGGNLQTDLVAETLDRLGEGRAVEPVGATELFAAHDPSQDPEPVTAELVPRGQADDLGWMRPALAEARSNLLGVDRTVEGGALLSSYERSLLIALGVDIPSDRRRAYLRRVDAAAADLAGAISAPEAFRITLTARHGTIPLTIDNQLDQEVTVRVELDSNQLEFPDGEEFELVVPPGGRRIDLDVRTLTSGAFPLHITLTSPDGGVVLDETTFDVRSTAISGVGLFLSIGAGLFLVVWWTRHWRRSRRRPDAEGALATASH